MDRYWEFVGSPQTHFSRFVRYGRYGVRHHCGSDPYCSNLSPLAPPCPDEPCDGECQDCGYIDGIGANSRFRYRAVSNTQNYNAHSVVWQGSSKCNSGQWLVEGYGCDLVCFNVDYNNRTLSAFRRDIATGVDGETLWTAGESSLPLLSAYSHEPSEILVSRDNWWEAAKYFYDLNIPRGGEVFGYLDGYETPLMVYPPVNGRFIVTASIAYQVGEGVHAALMVQIRSLSDGSVLSEGIIYHWYLGFLQTPWDYFSVPITEIDLEILEREYALPSHGQFGSQSRGLIPISDNSFIGFNPTSNFGFGIEAPFARVLTLDASMSIKNVVTRAFQEAGVAQNRWPQWLFAPDIHTDAGTFIVQPETNEVSIGAACFLNDELYALTYVNTPYDINDPDYTFPNQGRLVVLNPTTLAEVRVVSEGIVPDIVYDPEAYPTSYESSLNNGPTLVAHCGKLYSMSEIRLARCDIQGENEITIQTAQRNGLAYIRNGSWFSDWAYFSDTFANGIVIDTFTGGDDPESECAEANTCPEPEHCITCDEMQCIDGENCWCPEGYHSVCVNGICDCALCSQTGNDTCECPDGWTGTCIDGGCDCTGNGGCQDRDEGSPCTCLDGLQGSCRCGVCICGNDAICECSDCSEIGRPPINEGGPCQCENGRTGFCFCGGCFGCNGPDDCGTGNPVEAPAACVCYDGTNGTCRGGRCFHPECGAPCDCPNCGNCGWCGNLPPGSPCGCIDGREGICVNGECVYSDTGEPCDDGCLFDCPPQPCSSLSTGTCECDDGTTGTCDDGNCVGEDGQNCGPDDPPPDDCPPGSAGMTCPCADGSTGTCVGGECVGADGEDCGGGGGGGEPPVCGECEENCGLGGFSCCPAEEGDPCKCCGEDGECDGGQGGIGGDGPQCDCTCSDRNGPKNEGGSCTCTDGFSGTCQNGCCVCCSTTPNPCECFDLEAAGIDEEDLFNFTNGGCGTCDVFDPENCPCPGVSSTQGDCVQCLLVVTPSCPGVKCPEECDEPVPDGIPDIEATASGDITLCGDPVKSGGAWLVFYKVCTGFVSGSINIRTTNCQGGCDVEVDIIV